MAPLTRTQIEDRLREIDCALGAGQYEYAQAAANRTAANRDRELLIAEAFRDIEGTPTERRQLAIAKVGNFGKAEDVTYARLAAEMEVLHDRAMIGASLLKSFGKSDEDPRFRS